MPPCTSHAHLWGQLFQYSNAAWNLIYGPSCGPGTIGSDTMPFPGSQFYRVILENTQPNQAGALLFSWGAGSFDLGPLGAANCAIHLAAFDVVLPTRTDASGRATHTFALPDVPLFTGDLYWQFVYTWPTAPTPLQIGATRGMRTSVR